MTILNVKASLAQAKANVDKHFINPHTAGLQLTSTEKLQNDELAAGTVLAASMILSLGIKVPWVRIISAAIALASAGQLVVQIRRLHNRYVAESYGPRYVDTEGPTSSWNPNPYESH